MCALPCSRAPPVGGMKGFFDGGALDDVQLHALETGGELLGYRLAHPDEIGGLVRPRLWRRLRHAFNNLSGPGAVSIEDGQAGAEAVPAPSSGRAAS